MIEINFNFNLSNWQQIRKAPRYEDGRFRRFVKQNFPCVRTGVLSECNDFAHGINGKSKNKTASDVIGFPLNHELHLYELHGKEFGGNTQKWADHFGIDLQAQLKKQAIAYGNYLGISGSYNSLPELEVDFINASKRYRRKAA